MCAALLTLTACSSNPPPPPPPLVGAVTLQVGPAPDGAATCDVVPIPVTIRGGAADDAAELLGVAGAPVAPLVACTMRAEGATFEVDAMIALAPTSAFSISGEMSPTTSSVQATFERDGVTYESKGPCTTDFSANPDMGELPGRVWAIVTCPQVQDQQGHTCFASAQFVFTGCEE
jgi:hypothetical protein